jgi:proline iminopeptidase
VCNSRTFFMGLGIMLQFLIAPPSGAANSTEELSEGTVDVPFGSLHYTIRGHGEPMLILSGGPGLSSDYLIPVAAELSSSYQTILVDQRGTGRSKLKSIDSTSVTLKLTVDDLELVRRHLGIKTWYVLGHSWGGMLGMMYLTEYPSAVRALALVGSGGPTTDFFEPFGDNLEARRTPADRDAMAFWRGPAQVQADPQRASYERLRAGYPAYFFDGRNAWPLVEALRPESYSSAIDGLLRQDLALTRFDLRPRLRNVHVAALILHCHQDPVPESVALEIQSLLEGSQLRFLDRCGHYPWLEQADKLYEVLRGFFSALPTAGASSRH